MHHDPITRLYGIGIGPGEAELLTLKAKRLLEEADIVFAPKARIKSDSLALDIVLKAGVEPSKIKELEFPMVLDKTLLARKWKDAADQILTLLPQGKTGAFITLGDPSIYSTWTYLKKALLDKSDHIEVNTVPGISTMNAAAAVLDKELVIGKQKMALIPLPRNLDEIEGLLSYFDTIVIYKVSNRLKEFQELMARLDLTDHCALVSRVGLEGEKIFPSLNDIHQEEAYLSTAIIHVPSQEKGE
ncbi:precorrin-2 C(20)-methyltransferase [Spirochaeta cellobiosiphila]|uniref:precorrin-2 C(20)-methyltransferase n=1 Tax=Spirochaeta cellobiosiphila TaxID=504483 RepID=UPI0004278615|nr:precorrin-2 C(20)-methyltransferase [Spirochaeta cellobiosiphila]